MFKPKMTGFLMLPGNIEVKHWPEACCKTIGKLQYLSPCETEQMVRYIRTIQSKQLYFKYYL